MTKTTKRVIFFQKFAAFTSIAKAMGIDLLIVDFFRTTERQKELFDEGKSQCDGTTKRSAHQDRLAIDAYVVKSGVLILDRTADYEKLGYIWKEMFDGIWGGDWSFNDIFHYQAGAW